MTNVQQSTGADSAPQAPIGLAVQESPGRGRGVFAMRAFCRGEVLERAPVIVVLRADLRPLRGSLLDDYWFWWDEEHSACPLGWAALYNHRCPANVTFRLDHAARTIVFEAAADIGVGDEVTINYHGDPTDGQPVWFEAH